MITGWAELLLTLLVGMGPLKAVLVFVEKTEDYDQATRDKVALIGVATAVGSGLGLLFLGASMQALLHFSIGALSLSGGLILLLFALKIVLSTSSNDDTDHTDPVDLAVSPIGLPLILNPVGIVALVTFSAETETNLALLHIAAAIIVMGVIDIFFLLLAGRVGTLLPHPLIELLEKVFSILVAAMAIEIMVEGGKALGII